MSEFVFQKGILSDQSEPKVDADVIMTVAVVGYAVTRLREKKNVRFDVEVKDLGSTELTLNNADLKATRGAVGRLNALLLAGGYSGKELCQVGVSPLWGSLGGNGQPINRITGGTGDQDVHSSERYEPSLPPGHAELLLRVAQAPGVGYQGRGAYTGFVAGQTGGTQTSLKSTFRHNAPPTGQGRRWHPTPNQHIPGSADVGGNPTQKVWGMIVDNHLQDHPVTNVDGKPEPFDKRGLKQQGMHFVDAQPVAGKDIQGYTHGMIQAIYDVKWRGSGTPYEIAVGTLTTKLASCFPCSLFMEATGHPASSTHLGRGESWLPEYPAATGTPNARDSAINACNTDWADYCRKILTSGLDIVLHDASSRALIAPTHLQTVEALKQYLSGKDARAHANVILDALTLHSSELDRLQRTLAA
ncbi:MAG: hypothetical protein ABW123_10365 [Cystobacter sp.]